MKRRYRASNHLITIAPTRTGRRGRDVLIPALLEGPDSCVVIDPKSELAAVTSARRGRYGKVICLDPFGYSRTSDFSLGDLKKRVTTVYPVLPKDDLHPDSREFGAVADKRG